MNQYAAKRNKIRDHYLRIPPRPHNAKYFGEYNSTEGCAETAILHWIRVQNKETHRKPQISKQRFRVKIVGIAGQGWSFWVILSSFSF